MNNSVTDLQQIAINYHQITNQIKEFSNTPVNLVAVSKGQNACRVKVLLQLGHRCFGENKVQEALTKWPALKLEYPDIKLHLLGHLQSNKIRDALSIFDVIETLDTEKTAANLSLEMIKQNKFIDCFIQVNLGREVQKFGVMPERTKELIDYCQNIKLKIKGLMSIQPINQPAPPYFELLTKLAYQYNLPIISQGMSDDFLTALEFGSNNIRIGRGIFGSRIIGA